MSERFLGGHTRDAGGIVMAIRRAGAAGMRAVQVFSAPPTYYNERVSVRPDRAARVHEALAAAGIARRHMLVHAAYVLNVASADGAKAQRARAGLAAELARSTALGAGACCLHPGSSGDADPGEACDRVGDAVRQALECTPESESGTRLLIENTAGAGHTMGRSPEEIARMLARVPPALRHRTGYGLDTCHLFASGHDIATSPETQRAALESFERAIGEPPGFFHLNDSQHPFGSNRDRHALLGEGTIGVEPFRWLLADSRTMGVPLVLETPQDLTEVGEEDPAPDPADLRMMALLKALLPG